jgi:hypothetical protein
MSYTKGMTTTAAHTNLLAPAPVATDQLAWFADRKAFVAELSDLGPRFAFGRVWNDSCDEGLTLVSHRTGRRVVCVVEWIERDREGDTAYWQLRPVNAPAGTTFTVTIFND